MRSIEIFHPHVNSGVFEPERRIPWLHDRQRGGELSHVTVLRAEHALTFTLVIDELTTRLVNQSVM